MRCSSRLARESECFEDVGLPTSEPLRGFTLDGRYELLEVVTRGVTEPAEPVAPVRGRGVEEAVDRVR